MQWLIDLVFHWKPLTGYRTVICQAALVLIAAYQAAVSAHLIGVLIDPATVTTLVTLLTAYAAKFASEHQTP